MTLSKGTAGKSRVLHRIKKVRNAEGISLSMMARRMNKNVSVLRVQEEEDTDLTLTELYCWQKALNVPLRELLVEPEGALSEPIRTRATVLRIAATAKAILSKATSRATRHLAQDLLSQLIDLMPELQDIMPELNCQRSWREYGSRNKTQAIGRTAERTVDTRAIKGESDKHG